MDYIEGLHSVSTIDKRLLHQTIKKRKNEIFNYEQFLMLYVEDYSFQVGKPDIYHYLSSVPATALFHLNEPLNTYFPCVFFPKRFAWFSEAPTETGEGKIRYFTKAHGSNQMYSFDTLDLLQIYHGEPLLITVSLLVESGEEHAELYHWVNTQQGRIEDNQEWIANLTNPLAMFFKPQGRIVYQCLTEVALNLLQTKYIPKNPLFIFYVSMSYISEKTEMAISTVNKWINFFCYLGLLDKVETDEIPTALLEKSEMFRQKNKKHRMISFFTLPHLPTIEPYIQMQQEMAKKHRITYAKMSKVLLSELLAKEEGTRVYGTHVSSKSEIIEEQDRYIQRRLYKRFIRTLIQKGYVTQSLISRPLTNVSAYKLQSVLNRHWKEWIHIFHLTYEKPTLERKKAWKLPNLEYIAYPKFSSPSNQQKLPTPNK